MPSAILTSLAAALQLLAGILSFRIARASAWRGPWTIVTFGMFLACLGSVYQLFTVSSAVSLGGSGLPGGVLYVFLSLIMATVIYSVRRMHSGQTASESSADDELRQLLDALPDCILHVDCMGLVKGSFPAHEHHIFPVECDRIGRPFTQVLPRELAQTVRPELDRVFRNNKSRNFVTCVHIGGDTKDLEVRLVPMGDGGAVIVIGDITDRIRAKEALEASEARLISTIENLPFDFFSINADGIYDHQNATCRQHWGQLVGHRPEDMASNDEVREQWTDNNRRAFAGETVEGEVEYEFDGKKGYFYNIVAPIRQDNHISGILGVNIDITERKRAEEALRESEAKFKALVEESLVGVYLIQDQSVQYVNPRVEKTVGYTSDQLMGRQLPEELIHPDDKAMVADNIRKRIDGETKSINYTFRCIAADGDIKHIEVHGTRTMYGGKPAIIGTMIDVTERTKEEEQRQRMRATLDRAEKMEAVGILAGGVAHELNNILGPVVAYPDIISKKLPDDSPVKKQVELIGKSAREAASIIRDLITLARRDNYEMVSTDFNSVIGTYLDSPDFEKLMVKNRRIVVEQNLDKQLPTISGCPTHLVKVVMNLMRNAVAAMPEGGKVTITTQVRQLNQLLSGYDKIEQGEYVILKVSDTGAEIPEEDLKRMFEPYYSRNQHIERHSGLNLAVVYGIIKDHKGYYDVFSSAETGTDLVIYLPTAPVTDRQVGTSMDDLTGRESILIVDDSEDLCEIAREILESQGYGVAVSSSGRQAVEYLKNHTADLVVLDMIMEEDFDGLDTYREILKLHPEQRAIVVSAYSANERVQQLQLLGVGQYVKKPYSADTLARAVRNELNRQTAGNPT